MAGAAGATALSKVFSFIVLIIPYLKGHTIIKLSYRNIAFVKKDLLEVFRNGIPAFLRMSLMTFGSILTNRIARTFGTAVLAGISIANKIYRFISSAIMGFGQGFGPCAGYCWGAKEYERTKTLYFVTCRIGMSVGIVLSILMYVFAGQMISIFNHSSDPVVMEIGMFKLRVLCIGLLPHIFTMITNNLYQSLGRPLGSTILGLSRQMIFLIPSVLILPRLFGEYGIAAAQGTADTLAGIFIALPFGLYMIKKINETEAQKNGSPV